MITDELRRMKPLSGKERLGMNRESEYMGAEDIDPGTEPVLTIKHIYNGMVTLSRGKENKDVIEFAEETVPGIRIVRPLIVNSTNRKTLRKLFRSVSADALEGKAISLYLEHNVRDPSTGDKVDGIRIRPRAPVQTQNRPVVCEQCGQEITGVGGYSAQDVAQINRNRFGKALCAACSKKIGENSQDAEKAAQEAISQSVAEALMEDTEE